MRLRRNCTLESVYLVQSQELSNRFVSKGYSRSSIMQEIEKVRALERNNIVADKPKDVNKEHANYKML